MKIKYLITLLALSSAGTYAAENPPWQVPIPKTAAEVPGPVPGNTMTNDYVLSGEAADKNPETKKAHLCWKANGRRQMSRKETDSLGVNKGVCYDY